LEGSIGAHGMFKMNKLLGKTCVEAATVFMVLGKADNCGSSSPKGLKG
jgi:hypothetical protein